MILLFVPAFFLLVYGYALNFDIRHISLGVQDNDRSSASRELISAFINSGYFDFAGELLSDEEMTRAVNRGDVRAILVVPARFGADAGGGRPARVQVIINGDNANTATTVLGYSVGIVAAVSARYEVQGRMGTTGPLVTLEP